MTDFDHRFTGLEIFETFEGSAETGDFDFWGDADSVDLGMGMGMEMDGDLIDVPSYGHESAFKKELDELAARGVLNLKLVGEDCVGGTYFVFAGRDKVGVFKPCDEEASLPANPKGMDCSTDIPKTGFVAGQGYLREIAAYELDHNGFANVPETILYNMPGALLGRGPGRVKGSLQRFKQHDLQSWDVPPGRFSAEDTRRIAVLDLRLLNCDRHGGNILVKQEGRLVPIDHGYVLPVSSLQDLDFEWMMWPQAKTHFTQAEEQYIMQLSPVKDADILSRLNFPATSILYCQLATVALQIAVQKGLTPYQVGTYFRREQLDVPSMLEEAVALTTRNGAADLGLFKRVVGKQLEVL
eukprot:TRINITY_DN71_c1_g2_i1.p1 TRINITY_DN71_c1_g2~~TRINITY_DN71_c1_g2_i1.p1  ORF type:complete len:354 (+),score=99.31 TRINITY_DN71_c1_g2_i1:275-1336(+)